MVRSSQNRGPVLLAAGFISLCAFATPLWADYLDDMGYTKLVAKLGGAMPTGAGVPVAQVEVSASATSSVYLPQAAPATGTYNFPGLGNFSGKTIIDVSQGPGTVSGHARDVATFFYGNRTSTDPALDAQQRASMAPGVPVVSSLLADDYFLGNDYALVRDRKVHSHAWVFTDTGGTFGTNSFLRRLDEDIDTHGYLPVVGLNNGGVVPELLASGYNILSVGLTNGVHSTGTTPASVDGAGRVKPEIVAPGGIPANFIKTSFSTGQVASAAALLYELATSVPAHANACDESEVMKAILMAGATKEEFPTWSNSLTVPLDATFGAGEVNVCESYDILSAGEQAAGGAVGPRGWDFGAVPSGSPAQEYTITVPNQFYADVSIVVTWNRFKDGNGPMAPYVVHDLNLRLVDASPGTISWDRSESAIENVEHIYYRNLPPGQYVAEVTRDPADNETTQYGLAWRLNLHKGPLMEATFSGPEVSLGFADLDPRVQYSIERSANGLTGWTSIHSFTPATPTNADTPYVDTTATGSDAHYRLAWAFYTN